MTSPSTAPDGAHRRRPRLALVGALLLLVACEGSGRRGTGQRGGGAVVSEHPLATAVGLEVLEQGGNAADAAVATALALAVVYPTAGNLGGGGFALIVPYEGAPSALDFREEAPSGYVTELYLDEAGKAVPARSRRGALSIGIPGSPAGLYGLWREFGSGRFQFDELVAPALKLAREGFAVDPWLARDLEDPELFERMNVTARGLFYPRGEALRAGDPLVQPALAKALEVYAREGPTPFYQGRIANDVLREIQRTPIPGFGLPPNGSIRHADFAAYEPEARTPLRGSFRGCEVISMPPPSSGGLVVLQVLAILEGLPLESELERDPPADGDPLTPRMAHWWIEALRLAFADRAEHMGDPDFHDVPSAELLAPEWIATRRTSIGERANPDVGPWLPPAPEREHTTHLSVLDAFGNAVSLTTTLNDSYGSAVMVEGWGFLLNNELDDFAIQPGAPNMYGLVGSAANAIAPGKRPLSSMTPTVVRGPERGDVLVLGSPGGPRIITAVIQVLLRVLVLDQSLAEAIAAPRLHQQWQPRETWLEATDGFRVEALVVEGLEQRGHPLAPMERSFGSVQGIRRSFERGLEAVSDPRRGGAAGIEGRGVGEPASPR